MLRPVLVLLSLMVVCSAGRAAELLVEAEAFQAPGGWVIDAQFMDVMGSPYLLAHGLGKPVANARTQVEFPQAGAYRLWVRTKDWAPSHHPGRFAVLLDGVAVDRTFGNQGQDWLWQDGGTVQIAGTKVRLELADPTGFDGRCDALLFTTDEKFIPPAQPGRDMAQWRRRLLGLPADPPEAGRFDVVVVGGGIAGTSAAVAAARLGLTVALIQDRPVLGGNNSPEIRVGAQGKADGPIVGELSASAPPGPRKADWAKDPSQVLAGAAKRQKAVDAEPAIRQFLSWHAFAVHMRGSRIESIDARHTRTGQELRFSGPIFIDCTGDGSVGSGAGADYRMGREARSQHDEPHAPPKADKRTLGCSLLWASRDSGRVCLFPHVPWALEVSKDLAATGGDWTWEYGAALDDIQDAEAIRDHLLRAIYGAFSTAKDTDPRNATLELSWVAYVLGKRESRRLMGDYVLTENDLRAGAEPPDAVAGGSWYIDLHRPSDRYDFRVSEIQLPVEPYPIPFRCLYSRNVENLMMAGRDISATHVALSSARVMNTCGGMGVAVGAAASLCKKYQAVPRAVARDHIRELQDIVNGRGDYRGALQPRPVASTQPAQTAPARP